MRRAGPARGLVALARAFGGSAHRRKVGCGRTRRGRPPKKGTAGPRSAPGTVQWPAGRPRARARTHGLGCCSRWQSGDMEAWHLKDAARLR